MAKRYYAILKNPDFDTKEVDSAVFSFFEEGENPENSVLNTEFEENWTIRKQVSVADQLNAAWQNTEIIPFAVQRAYRYDVGLILSLLTAGRNEDALKEIQLLSTELRGDPEQPVEDVAVKTVPNGKYDYEYADDLLKLIRQGG